MWQGTWSGVRAGGLDTTSVSFSSNHKEEKTRGEDDSLSPQPLNVLARAAAVTAEQCRGNPSKTAVPVRGARPVPETCSKTKWHESDGGGRGRGKDRHAKRKTRDFHLRFRVVRGTRCHFFQRAALHSRP